MARNGRRNAYDNRDDGEGIVNAQTESPRVRPEDAAIRALIDRGIERSATFRDLITGARQRGRHRLRQVLALLSNASRRVWSGLRPMTDADGC